MNVERLIGSTGVRAATLAVLSLVVTAVVLEGQVVSSSAQDALFVFSIVGGFIAFILLIHCFRALYSWWMRLAVRLQKVVVVVLFGACYLFIVPWFFLIARALDARRHLGHSDPASFWIPRRGGEINARYFARMG